MRTIEEYKELLYNKELDKKLLYQPLEHPAFADWEAQQPCVERWNMMSKDGITTAGIGLTVLDLGCHTGWFCRKFSHAGWKSIGIDKDPLALEIASELMRPFDGPIHPNYYNDDIQHMQLPYADIALCLSVVMYIFSREDNGKSGYEFLDRVSSTASVMYFDYGGMYAKHLPTDHKQFAERIVANTQYKRFKLLGYTGLESRPFYVFER